MGVHRQDLRAAGCGRTGGAGGAHSHGRQRGMGPRSQRGRHLQVGRRAQGAVRRRRHRRPAVLRQGYARAVGAGGAERALRAGGVGCISATANVNPKAIADLAAHWRESNADERQAGLDQVRGIFAKYQMIAGMKTAVAHYTKDPEWLRVRPPLMQLTAEQQAQLLAELKAINFSMPGL